jgi:hypothetical protein
MRLCELVCEALRSTQAKDLLRVASWKLGRRTSNCIQQQHPLSHSNKRLTSASPVPNPTFGDIGAGFELANTITKLVGAVVQVGAPVVADLANSVVQGVVSMHASASPGVSAGVNIGTNVGENPHLGANVGVGANVGANAGVGGNAGADIDSGVGAGGDANVEANTGAGTEVSNRPDGIKDPPIYTYISTCVSSPVPSATPSPESTIPQYSSSSNNEDNNDGAPTSHWSL